MSDAPTLLEIPLAVNLLAVFVGSLVGVVRAADDKRIDLVGMFALAAALGFGGGIVRDVLLGILPPAAFRDGRYLFAAVVATLIGAVAVHYLRRVHRVLWALDSLSIGLFACVGANAALLSGLGPLPSIMVGTCASVGGVIIADVLQGKPSSIVVIGPPNAVAGLAGAMLYTLVFPYLPEIWVTVLAVAVTFSVRLTGPVFSATVPRPIWTQPLQIRRRSSPGPRGRDRG